MTDQPDDFDGCHRQCRTTGAHTLVWGGCEHATPTEPAVTVMRVRHLSDGAPGLVCESIPVTTMAARIEALLRAAQGGGYAAQARAVAENLAEGEAPHEMQGSADPGGLADDDRELRRRSVRLAMLHANPFTRDGKPRRTGYALEEPE